MFWRGRGWVSLLFLMVWLQLSFSRCEVPVKQQSWIDTPGTRYIIANNSVDCYTKETDNRIRRNGKLAFTGSGFLQIIDFDVLQGFNLKGLGISYPEAATLIGLLLRRDQAIYLEIDDCQTGAAILVKKMTRYHPWKIRFADVDGDNVAEVCLGVFKKSPLHPIETKRLFIFNLQPGLPPKWLGSRLSRPFQDFEFMPQPAGQMLPARLFALEINQSGLICLNSYGWDSFGFVSSPVGAPDNVENPKIFDATAFFAKGIFYKKGSFAQGLFIMNQQQTVTVYQEEAAQK